MTDKGNMRSFMNLSGRMHLGGLGATPLKLNVKPGDWTLTYERDDRHKIIDVTMACRMQMVDGAFVPGEAVSVEYEPVKVPSGIIYCTDGKLGNDLPEYYKVPENMLNPRIVEEYGRPDDEGKPKSDRFLESCYHLSRDWQTSMPLCESTPFGMVSYVGKGKANVALVLDRMRDVVGIEIRP